MWHKKPHSIINAYMHLYCVITSPSPVLRWKQSHEEERLFCSECQLCAAYLHFLFSATINSLKISGPCNEKLPVALQFPTHPPQGIGERGFVSEWFAVLFPLDCYCSDSAKLTCVSKVSWARWGSYFIWKCVGRSAVFKLGAQFCLPLSFHLAVYTGCKMSNKNK